MKFHLTLFLIFYLISNDSIAQNNNQDSIILPEMIVFGQDYNQSLQLLKPFCTKIKSQEIKPAQIPDTLIRQMQLDCHGFNFAGKNRLAEFVFKDDKLFLVWILIDKKDIESIEGKMLHEYKNATVSNPLFLAFSNYNTALRKDIPEVLFYSQIASKQFEMWFQSVE